MRGRGQGAGAHPLATVATLCIFTALTTLPPPLSQDLTPQMGSNCNADGALAFEYWPDEAAAHPSFVYIKGGLKPTKC